jgi:CRISPR/Cas system-associated endonuclease Cas1
MRREIPVSWHSYGGWFLGHSIGVGHKNVELRTAQYKGSFDEQVCLRIAKGLVRAKVQNSRTLMRRNWRGDDPADRVLLELKRFIAAFERRLNQEVTHPLFGYRLSYRRLLEVQARLLARSLLGDISDYPNFTTR